MDDASSGSTLERMVGGCSETTTVVMGADVLCLLDTWGTCFNPNGILLPTTPGVKHEVSGYFQHSEGQLLARIGFIGYVELDANIWEKYFLDLGF